jgi:hypothetical protein
MIIQKGNLNNGEIINMKQARKLIHGEIMSMKQARKLIQKVFSIVFIFN